MIIISTIYSCFFKPIYVSRQRTSLLLLLPLVNCYLRVPFGERIALCPNNNIIHAEDILVTTEMDPPRVRVFPTAFRGYSSGWDWASVMSRLFETDGCSGEEEFSFSLSNSILSARHFATRCWVALGKIDFRLGCGVWLRLEYVDLDVLERAKQLNFILAMKQVKFGN